MLTEIFTGNEALLESVDDKMIASFIHLIRTVGRHERFVSFLIRVCQCHSKAVRTNQWRICRMLVQGAPELLIHLKLSGGDSATSQPVVCGDPRFFPRFESESELPLVEWLRRTDTETRTYFERTIELYSFLCQGRNLVNAPIIQSLLPYKLLLAIVKSESLQHSHRSICAQFVGIIRTVYVDVEPHEEVLCLRTVRMWKNVETIARSHHLSSRIMRPNPDPVDWHAFDDLKQFVVGYLMQSGLITGQIGTQVSENMMLHNLLMTLYELVRAGFFFAEELRDLLRPVLQMLDARKDRTGIENDPPSERYMQRHTVESEDTVACDTIIMMECKYWLCKLLDLIVTARLDIRLSLVLNQ